MPVIRVSEETKHAITCAVRKILSKSRHLPFPVDVVVEGMSWDARLRTIASFCSSVADMIQGSVWMPWST